MRTIRAVWSTILVLLAVSLLLGGCATLSVTPLQQITEQTGKQPVTLGIQVNGERLREALSNTQESAVNAATGKLFNKVILLPKDSRYKSSAEIRSTFDTDYILTGTLSDISVQGNLNPYWFAAAPLLLFKPYAPIVTFEATVNIETSLHDARTGTVVFTKEISATATDHFSPIEPQDKVRKLVGRGINNAFIGMMGEIQKKIQTNK